MRQTIGTRSQYIAPTIALGQDIDLSEAILEHETYTILLGIDVDLAAATLEDDSS